MIGLIDLLHPTSALHFKTKKKVFEKRFVKHTVVQIQVCVCVCVCVCIYTHTPIRTCVHVYNKIRGNYILMIKRGPSPYIDYDMDCTIHSSDPGRSKPFFSSLKRQDRLWGQTGLLISGCLGHLPPGVEWPGR